MHHGCMFDTLYLILFLFGKQEFYLPCKITPVVQLNYV